MATAAGASARGKRTRTKNPRVTRDWTGTIGPKVAVLGTLITTALIAGLVATSRIHTATVPGLSAPVPVVEYGLPTARVLFHVAALIAIGTAVLPRLLRHERSRRAEPTLWLARRIGSAAAALWLVSTLPLLALQAAEVSPGRPVTLDVLVNYSTTVPAGQALLASAGTAVAYLLLGLVRSLRSRQVADLRAVAGLAGLLPLPLTGHAAGQRFHEISAVSIQLHVLTAAVWTGGLAAIILVIAPRTALLAETLPRFSRMATVAIGVVAVTGMVNGVAELLSTPGIDLGGLVTTTYGLLVLGKTGCLVALAGIAAVLRYRLLPRIARHRRTALLGWATTEIGLLGITYGLGVVLARAPVV